MSQENVTLCNGPLPMEWWNVMFQSSMDCSIQSSTIHNQAAYLQQDAAVRAAFPGFQADSHFPMRWDEVCMDPTEVNRCWPSVASLPSLEQHFYFDIPEMSQNRKAERIKEKGSVSQEA
jgi:hypothetical protein